MSLNADDSRLTAVKTLLRSTDQFQLWKARVTAACWSSARRDIFTVTDDQCIEAINAAEKGEQKNDWVGKSWLILINSLHDDLFIKVAHIEQGHIAAQVTINPRQLLAELGDHADVCFFISRSVFALCHQGRYMSRRTLKFCRLLMIRWPQSRRRWTH